MENFPPLGQYRIVEHLGESLQSDVYKGFHGHGREHPLTIKVLKLLSGAEEQARYLRQKIERLRVLHDPRTCTPTALENEGDLYFIVQPWFSGTTLDRWREGQSTLPLPEFFEIACNLADMLQAVHEAGIVHGGVKPHNILIQPGTLDLRLIDFITPLDIRDVSHFIYDPRFVRDTLAYTSPEQTGRINHRVDFSTDLYSLGIVLYELLTGKLPFFSTDPLALIHSHLAEEVPKAHRAAPGTPPQLSEIITRLTLKEPEKRYQSAAGLRADLIRCRDEYLESGSITPFPTGLRDRTRRVIFISKMVGRQEHAATILAEYDRAAEGAFRSMFISGLSGIGKTRLIQELQRPLVRNRGYFTSGKFDQYQKNIPYSSLIQALRNLLRTYLTESDTQVAKWNTRILDALGPNGRVVADVLPELHFIIGPQPEVAHLPPVEARNRFNTVLGHFLQALAGADHPLVLFIDDLQWCDIATFDFLQYLFANHEDYPHLFFIGAFRHNEVDDSHPLTRLMRGVEQQNGPISEIRLGALTATDCHEMVAYILDAPLQETVSLAGFITNLTEGNPLFVSESLSWLYNENLLYLDDQRHWRWDMARIRDAQMPATVVELFSTKVRKLPRATLDVLEHCACMGNRFTPQEVAVVTSQEIPPLFETLKPVLSLGMLLENKSDLQFVHDRVQEAVLRDIAARRRKAIHWRIGNRLLGDIPAWSDLEQRDNLFTIAAHLNRGRPVHCDEATAWRLVRINMHAGNKALDALATEAANEFFSIAHGLLPDNCWESGYAATYRIHQRLAKTELMCGHYEASETLINRLLEQAQTDLDKAEALAEQTTSLSSIGNFNKAIESANRGLAFFGKAIPDDPAQATERMLAMMAEIAAQGDVWNTILHMPFTEERESKVELAFYSELIPDLYMSGLVPQLYLSAAQSTTHCLKGGMDESVIYSFSIMGLNLGEQEQFELAFRYEDLAHDLCAKYPNTFGATRGMNGIVWCNMHSRSHPRAIVDYSRKSIQSGRNCGDLYNAGLSYGPLMWNLVVQGERMAEIVEAAEECMRFSRKNQLAFSAGLAEAVQQGWIATMDGEIPDADMEPRVAQWVADNHIACAGSYFVLLGLAHQYLGNDAEAARHLARVEDYLSGLTDNVLKRLWYVFRVVNMLRRSTPEHAAVTLREVQPLLDKIETWSKLGPLLGPYLGWARAELARVRGDALLARNLYLDAITTAHDARYLLLEARLNESLGMLLTETGMGVATPFYDEALRLYRQCGNSKMAERLLQREPRLHEVREDIPGKDQPDPTHSAKLPDLDVSYLMKSAMAIAAETDLEQLLRKIMSVVLESSGAQHGFLLTKEDDRLVVMAESHVGDRQPTRVTQRELAETPEICQAVVNYVFRTREKVILDDAGSAGPFQDAPEVKALQLRSLLCLPVIKQAVLIGVLYLDNRLAQGVFTSQKSGTTELLTSHAAISLENARLLLEVRRLNEGLEQRLAEITQSRDALALEVEQRKQAESRLRDNENNLRQMLETSPVAIRISSLDGHRLLFANQSYAELIGMPLEQIEGIDPRVYYTHPEQYEQFMLAVRNKQRVSNQLVEVSVPQTGAKWSLLSLIPIDYQGQPAVLGWIYDITERVKSEEQRRLWSLVFESTQEGIMITDQRGNILDVNRAFSEITGYPREQVLGRNPNLLKSGVQTAVFYQDMWRGIQENGHWAGEIINQRSNGEIYPEWLTISAVRDQNGSPTNYVGIFADITQIKKYQTQLEHIAHYDALTGVPNRVLLADRMRQSSAQMRRDNKLLAVCYLDLDGFKAVNDTLGHDSGDRLLVEMTKRMAGTLREGDTVARLGGDEFVILLQGLDQVSECANTLQRLLESIAAPLVLKGREVAVSASIGVSIFPLDDEDADTLLRHADQAMYVAKQSGKNRFHLFDHEHDQRTRTRQDVFKSIESALDKGEFKLFYQPKVAMQSNALVGAEALIRWHHPERGLVAPGEFLPVIENSPLEIRLGQWVIQTALKQAAAWQQAGLALQVSVNIAGHHLESPDFIAQLQAALAAWPALPPGTLQVEVLETAALEDITRVNQIITACMDAGVSFALDDFGTGYSSLTYLRSLPADTLKIDQSFVRDMLVDDGDHAIVAGIIALAEAFGRTTVAEGVETAEHFSALRALGCEVAQGYGIARPMPAQDFLDWAERRKQPAA